MMLLSCVLVLLMSNVLSLALEPTDSSCILEHYFGAWHPKAKLTFSTMGGIRYESLMSSLTSSEIVQYLASPSSLYEFRLNCVNSENKPYSVQSYVKGCALLHSELRENLYVALTPTRHVKAIHSKLEVDGSHCDPSLLAAADIPDEFSTNAEEVEHSGTPTRDTASFLKKLEEEEKQKMNPQDNRSFLQKYWMYILPAVIILFLNSQGGGGR